MLMTESNDPSRSGGRDITESRLAGFGKTHDESASTKGSPFDLLVFAFLRISGVDVACNSKHVWLPRRSLLVLEKEARYNWCHGISPRKFDNVLMCCRFVILVFIIFYLI